MTKLGGKQHGSTWRRWDLHIHTPGTKLSDAFGGTDDRAWDRYIDELEDSPVEVFGITDYFSCDTYFELERRYNKRKPDSTKRLFLNIEFRLSESISGDGGHPNIHVLFDNDPSVCGEEKIKRFLTNLNTQAIDNANANRRCADLKTKADYESATVSLSDLLKALKNTFGDAKPYLLAFPANNDGIRSTDTNSPRKVALADRIDKHCDIFFGNKGNIAYFLSEDRYTSGKSEPKPVVSASDAHSFNDLERLSGDVAGFPPTWIKADATFLGMQQICHEPEYRVHIGHTPDVILRQLQDSTKFLKTLQIDQVPEYGGENGQWFKRVNVPLNPELTAIIGNKGSGKSALLDIIGLLGDSRQEQHFSFLTNRAGNKKFRQRGYAENFRASITWLSGTDEGKLLSDNCNIEKPESVRYLPQNYFEKLTNEIEIEQFRSEIEEVVFSHVDETERLGKTSFSELEEVNTLRIKMEISEHKRQLRQLNIEIIKLEHRRSPSYRRTLEAEIDAKRQEVAALDAAKPKEVEKPRTDTEKEKTLAQKVQSLTDHLAQLKESIEKKTNELTSIKAQLQLARTLRERIDALERGLKESLEEIESGLKSLKIKLSDIISLSIDVRPLERKISRLVRSMEELQVRSMKTFDGHTYVHDLSTIPDLRAAYEHFSTQRDEIKNQLTAPQRRHQAYVETLNAWEIKRRDIVGSTDNLEHGTLLYLESSLKRIDTSIVVELKKKYRARQKIVRKILESKGTILGFYSNLKRSVEKKLSSVQAGGFEIEIDASIVVDREFIRKFLHLIDQRKRGPYRNNLEAQQWIGDEIRNTNWNDNDAVLKFCESLLERMRKHNNEELLLSDQAHDVRELYSYVFSLGYLSSKYELRLGGKDLNELSPGEKGLLLLIFYLQLDRKNTPLVIDQPEDNLDNDSIFKVLAKCIRDAKKRRQVVLVTHNPNLAVGADAEQIIYVKLDKAEGYKFSYECGSIENPRLNARIIDILEGSQPAFVKRRLKYGM